MFKYTELLRSCGLIENKGYWYSSQEDLLNNAWCCSEYIDAVRIANEVVVSNGVLDYIDFMVYFKDYDKIRYAIKCLLNKRKEKLIKLKLLNMNEDFV